LPLDYEAYRKKGTFKTFKVFQKLFKT
jgi:hypothetical protein